jgi:hypothetical protein
MCVLGLGAATVGLIAALELRDTRRTDVPIDQPVRGTTRVPWCVPDPDDPDGADIIVGAGAPIKKWCNGLWHHASATILVAGGTTYRVADGGLTPLGKGALSGAPVMSHDGRYAAWRLANCPTADRAVDPTLYIFEVATAREVARTDVPTTGFAIGPCSQSQVQGIDDLGRAYVELFDDEPGAHAIQMYDIRTGRWHRVHGIPPGTGEITYVTGDGIAVSTSPEVGDRSVEGLVGVDGRFVRQREVPVGRGLWSPDRTFVVDEESDGLVVRPAADLINGVALDLPVDEAAMKALWWHTQWESPDSVLVQGSPVGEDGDRFYRCDARSGACQVMHRNGMMALANNVPWGGG